MKRHNFSSTIGMRAILVCTLILSVCMPTLAASKSKPFNKKYKNERLEVVLNDLCKHNGYTLNILDQMDLDKRINAEFKNAGTSSVLKKVLDSDYQGKIKKGVMTITRKPTPPVVYTVAGTVVTEEIDNDSINAKTYQDTTFTITCNMMTFSDTIAPTPRANNIEVEDSLGAKRKGHNFQILLGAGYGSLGYKLGDAGKVNGGFSGNIQLRYLYYFTDNWGIGLGLGFSNYMSKGILNSTLLYYNAGDVKMPQTDSEGEAYGHAVRTNDWTEQQKAYMVDIPVMIQCTYPIKSVVMKNGPLKIYADLGANIGLSVAASRQIKSGSIDHMGWYKPWHLDLENIPNHDFYTEQAEAFGTDKQKLELKMPAVGLMADFGFAIPVADKVDLMIGAFANYTVNNVCKNEYQIGWKQNTYSGDLAYRNHEFMENYQGLIGAQYPTTGAELASKVHPWQAGIRVGINIHYVKKEKPLEPEITYRRENVCDTTYTLAARVETVIKPKPVVVEKIKRVLEKSVIWFDLNSTDPKLQPADILDKVAEILKENPEQKIMVTGHASKEGSKEANQRLSENRAKAIVDRLIDLGVSPDQIQSQGKGIDVDYVEGQHDISLDRRAEITPIVEAAAPAEVVE